LIEKAISEILQDRHNKYLDLDDVVKNISNDFVKKYTPKLQKDYLSFIRVAYALHLQSRIVNTTKGLSTTKSSEELCITEVDLTNPKMLFLDDTQRTWTASIKEYVTYLAPGCFSRDKVDEMVVALTRKLIQSRTYMPKFNTSVSRHSCCDLLDENELYTMTFSCLQELNNEVFVNDLLAIREDLPDNDTRRDDINRLLTYFNTVFEGIVEEGMEQAAV